MTPARKKWIYGLLIALATAALTYFGSGCLIGDFWPGIAKPGTNQSTNVTVNQGHNGGNPNVGTKPNL